MEATVVSVGKAVLDGALGYARSKVAEEVALRLGVEGDVAFIADELEMMQSFLMTADEERGQHKLLATWVKQVRDVAYNVEDSLMDFSLLSEKKKSWWRSPRTAAERRRIAKEVKELRAKVEDVSNRNLRYRLIKESSGSKPSAAEEQASIATAAMFGINEARLADLEKEKSKVDLHQLITSEEEELRVISVWGTSGDLGKMSVIQEVYDDPEIFKKFGSCAWIRLMHPFNPQEFLRSLVRQFYENSLDGLGKGEEGTSIGANVLMKMEKMQQNELVQVFNTQVSSHSYLIVIDNLSTIVEWHCIKKYFPDNKKHSRIIVSTQQVEIASLCPEKPYQVSELKQLSSDQTLYLFHTKVIPTSGSAVPSSDSIKATTTKSDRAVPTDKIQEEDQETKDAGRDKVSKSDDGKKFHRSRTMTLTEEVLTVRATEKSEVIELIGQTEGEEDRKVISVWGMGGLGKTTLVRSVYRSQQLSGWKRAWATALRPFNPEVLIRSLVLQLLQDVKDDPAGATATHERKEKIAVMKLHALKKELTQLLSSQKCLIVLDDISSTAEWDLVNYSLVNARRVLVTTREKSIAKHCSSEYKNMYSLQGLNDDVALDLFKRKVFKDNSENIDLVPDMMKQARLVLKKCDGLPLAISTIGGFLASRPKTVVEWRKMNDHISSELVINPELRAIKTVLLRSYDGLPYHLKSAFLYLSIFPEDHKIRWDRLVRRWIAEGYSRDMHGMTAEELGRKYFEELLDRSMILSGEEVNRYSGQINACQLHDIIREICISKAREENLVFTLEEGCCVSSTQGAIRHLVIGSNWKRDKDVLESMLDLSHVRSLTVFGECKPFFISDKMRFLRVLDLEDTIGLRDHDLDQIGELRHLKYLSLRGCHSVFYLPASFGNLRHLQTLDVRGTYIDLPIAITKLLKLQHLHGGYRDVKVHRGIGKLKALQTLGVVNIAPGKGKAPLNELKELTQLRKLGVTGVSGNSSKELWSAIAGHNQLRSLSVRGAYSYDESLDGSLGEGLSPPSSLESLKLRGKLVRVTSWIHQLQNLSKLTLEVSRLEQDDAIQALGVLPNLAVLRLKWRSFSGKQLHFRGTSFPSLVVLELYGLYGLESVSFEEEAVARLELLQVDRCWKLKVISGLAVLTSLREIQLGYYVIDELREEVKHLKHVRLNLSHSSD